MTKIEIDKSGHNWSCNCCAVSTLPSGWPFKIQPATIPFVVYVVYLDQGFGMKFCERRIGKMNDKRQPLSDIWDIYTESLDRAISDGLLQDDEVSDHYVWPDDLNIGDWEQEDVKRYVHERMTEIIDKVKTHGSLDPNLIAGYMFRSVISGMLWERERIG